MSKLKKILKFFGLGLLSVLGIVVLCLVLVSWKYHSIISKTPSNSSQHAQPGKLGNYVNTFIGTGGFPYWVCGFNFPGATVPFGMVRLSPETMSIYKDTKDFSTAGYYYADTKIMGFSHTRLSGTGAADGGHFLFTPTTTAIEQIDFKKDYTHTFSHEDETAFPGYYGVKLKNENILSEFTTTERTGVHRYTFSEKGPKNIIVHVTNTTGNYSAKNGAARVISEKNQIEGSVKTYGAFASRQDGIDVYFSAEFDKPFSRFGISDGNIYSESSNHKKSDSLKIVLNFDHKIVQAKVGISYISIENAKQNREVETSNISFNDILNSAKAKWEKKLALAQIDGGTEEQKTIFYSALYRSFQMPTIFNDVNKEYIGFDKQIHKTTDFTYYTDLSLWDTFRTVHPLYNLIAPKEQRDMLVSLTKMAEQGGSLPRWPMGRGYSNSMLGSPADIVIAESYLKGIQDFNVQLAFQKMKEVALNPLPKESDATGRRGVEAYLKYEYCPTELGNEAVSQTLEYAWSDHAISLLAEALDKPEDQALFKQHSLFYKNVWNPKTQYFQSRHQNRNFVKLFDPLKLTYFDFDKEYTKDYVEGSALQWRWAVPFDPDGLISLFQDKAYFIDELNAFFEKSDPKMATWTPGSYYWHGNEPDIHAAYLFNSAERPDLTQKWVRWILENKYDNSYVGIDGNDDAGTLSAWYIFSSLGLYPIAGSDIYQLGAPLFKSATLKLGAHTLNINTENYAPENIYAKEILLNDVPLDRNWIKHNEIADGGTLKFIMTNKPLNNIN